MYTAPGIVFEASEPHATEVFLKGLTMSAGKDCPECGAAMKPAMLRCRECGGQPQSRASSPPIQVAPQPQHVTPTGTSGETNSGVQVFGRSVPVRHVFTRPVPSRALIETPVTQPVTAHKPAKPVSVEPDQEQASATTEPVQTGSGPREDRPSHAVVAANTLEAAASIHPFVFVCACGARMRVPGDRGGRRKKCRRCSRIVVLTPAGAALSDEKLQTVEESDVRIRLDIEVERAVKRIQQLHGESCLKKTLSSRRLKKLTDALHVVNPLSRSEAAERRQAILTLGESHDFRVLELIRPLKSDDSENVRQAVATVAGQLGDPRGAEVAVQLLLDRDPDVLREALQSVRCLKEPVAVRPLLVLGLDNPLLKPQAYEAILRIGEAAVSELLDILETQTQGMVFDAVVVLGRIGSDRAIPALVDTLNNASGSIRGVVAEALAKIRNRDVLPNIIRLLDDEDQFVRLHAVSALKAMPDRRAYRPLTGCLQKGGDSELMRQTVLALGATKDSRAIPVIARMLASADESMRAAIADSMRMFDDPAACTTLLMLLRTGSPGTQLKALIALKKSATEEATADLFSFTNSPDARIRRHAVEVLAELAPPEAEDLFADLLLSDPVYDVRVAAAKGLGQLGISEASVTLEKALRDESPVRCAAVMSLARLGEVRAVPALIAMLRDPAPEVRYHAVTGLGRLQAKATVPAVQSMLDDSDAMVRKGAEKALSQLGIEKPRISVGRRLSSIAGGLLPDAILGSIPASSMASVVILVVASVACGTVLLLKDSVGGEPPQLRMARAETIKQVCWLPESDRAVLVRQSGTVEFWDTAAGTFIKGGADVRTQHLRYNSLTGNLILQGANGFASWDFTNEKPANPVMFGPPLPAGHSSVSAAADSRFSLIGLKPTPGRREYQIWHPDQRDDEPVRFAFQPSPSPAISGDGKWVAGWVPTRGLFVFSSTNGQPSGRITIPDANKRPKIATLHLNSDGSTLVGLAGRELIKVDLENTASPKTTWMEVPSTVSKLQFATGGSAVCIVQNEKAGRLDLSTGELETWPVTTAEINLSTISANWDASQIIVSGQDEKLAWLLDTTDGSVKEFSPVDIPPGV